MSSLASLMEPDGREPEERLWRAVVGRAILDAAGCPFPTTGSEWPRYFAQDRAEALEWFESQSRSMVAICEAAGLDPDETARVALELAERAEPMRKRHGHLSRTMLDKLLGGRLRNEGMGTVARRNGKKAEA